MTDRFREFETENETDVTIDREGIDAVMDDGLTRIIMHGGAQFSLHDNYPEVVAWWKDRTPLVCLKCARPVQSGEPCKTCGSPPAMECPTCFKPTSPGPMCSNCGCKMEPP